MDLFSQRQMPLRSRGHRHAAVAAIAILLVQSNALAQQLSPPEANALAVEARQAIESSQCDLAASKIGALAKFIKPGRGGPLDIAVMDLVLKNERCELSGKAVPTRHVDPPPVAAGSNSRDPGVPQDFGQITTPMLRINSGNHTGKASAATDPGGRIMVTVGDDKTARVWSLPTMAPLGVFRPPIGSGVEGMLYAAAVSPNGQLAAVGGWTGGSHGPFSIFFVDLGTRQVVRTVGGFTEAITSLAFSRDGSQFAVGLGSTKGIHVFGVKGDERFYDSNYRDTVYGLSFAPDGRLATASYDGWLRLYDREGRLSRRSRIMIGHPFEVAFSPDGSELAVGIGSPSRVEILDGSTLARRALPHTAGLNVLDQDERNLIISSEAAAAAAMDIRGPNENETNHVAWSSDGELLYGAGDASDGTDNFLVFVWNRKGRGERKVIARGFHQAISAVLPLPGGRLMVASTGGQLSMVDEMGMQSTVRQETAIDMRPADANDAPGSRFYLDPAGHQVTWLPRGSKSAWVQFDVATLDKTVASRPSAGLFDWSDHAGGLHATDWRLNTDPKLNGRKLELAQYESSLSVAVSADRALVGGDWSLRMFGPDTQQRWKQGLSGSAWRVNQSADGRLAVAALSDGTIRWFRVRDGQELLAVFFTRNAEQWVAFTPSGYYSASPSGEDLFGWQINRGPDKAADFYPASRFHDRFYRPDVIRLILKTLDESEALKLANAASERHEPLVSAATITTLLPPVLDLDSAPARFFSDTITIRYRIRNPSGAPLVGTPRVKVNGIWQPQSRAQNQIAPDGARTLMIGPLPPLDCTIEIYADNKNERSVPLTLSVSWDSRAALAPGEQGSVAQHKPHLFVLAVGVSDYQRADLRLRFAEHDAEQFVAAMEAQRGKRYADVTTKLLRGSDATRAGVKAGLLWLASRTASDDVGILFLAGHGVQTPASEYFFAPADFDPTRERETGIDSRTIRDALDEFSTHGNKAVFFVDTCYGGGALGPSLVASNAAAFAAALGQPDRGVIVLSASKGNQLSYEEAAWGAGAFTTALLEAIVQAKADPAQTGEITILNLGSYVHQRVRVLTRQRQEPMFIVPEGSLVDFAVASH